MSLLLMLSITLAGACHRADEAQAPVQAAPVRTSPLPEAATPSAPQSLLSPTTVKLALPTIDLNYLLPLSVAQAQGFFTEERIEAQWQQMVSTVAIPALLNREVDLAPGGTVVTAAAQGAPLRAVFFPYNTSTFQFSVDPRRVREPRDLVDQTVGIASVRSSQEIATRLILRSLGVDPLAVKYLPLGGEHNRVAAMLSGQIVASANNPNVAVELRRQGFSIIANSATVFPVPWSGYGTHLSYIQEHGPTLRAWMRAMIRALQFVRQNPATAAENAARALDMDPTIVQESLPLLLETMYPEDPGGFTETGMLELIRVLREDEPGMREAPIDEVADVMPLREAQRSLGVYCRGGYKC
ncbi:MAG TPA: ABC transporter substrate-binding protein [Chloroflexota bacterium]|nr:ABC transporter substrate-binding protein [Chloroflexota bacterium]